MIYKVNATEKFDREYVKLTKRNLSLKQKINDVIEILAIDQFSSVLISHKVQTVSNGVRWSSRVTGDIRIIWDYDPDKNIKIIDLWNLGTHSGSNKVYK